MWVQMSRSITQVQFRNIDFSKTAITFLFLKLQRSNFATYSANKFTFRQKKNFAKSTFRFWDSDTLAIFLLRRYFIFIFMFLTLWFCPWNWLVSLKGEIPNPCESCERFDFDYDRCASFMKNEIKKRTNSSRCVIVGSVAKHSKQNWDLENPVEGKIWNVIISLIILVLFLFSYGFPSVF